MNKFGPDRSELRFRLWFSIGGLCLLAGGLLYRRGEDFGPGAWEAVITAVLFFGGTLAHTIHRLRQKGDQ